MTDCLFCKIAEGKLKANVVHQDEHVMAFRDINPQAPTHILVIPKKHIDSMMDLHAGDMGVVGKIHTAAKELAKRENLEKDGFRFLTNIGRNGGQTVKHLHYHLLGGRPMSWPPG